MLIGKRPQTDRVWVDLDIREREKVNRKPSTEHTDHLRISGKIVTFTYMTQ